MRKSASVRTPAIFLFLSASVIIFSGRAADGRLQTAQQPPELAEASQLSASVVNLFVQGKYDEAAPLAKRALDLREKVLSKDDERVVLAVLNLAEVQYARGKYDDAKELFERARHSYERTLKPGDPRLIRVLDSLALNYFALGQPLETERIYKTILAVRGKNGDVDSPSFADSLYHLAEFYQFQGQYQTAEPLYERLIEIRTKSNTNQEARTQALDRYACLLRKEKRIPDAERVEAETYSSLNPAASEIITSGVVNGKAIHLVTPPYPAEAINGKTSGRVTVRVLINENGDVIRVCAIDGPKVLMKVSESAAAMSKFTPTLVNQKAVEVSGVIIYNFVAR